MLSLPASWINAKRGLVLISGFLLCVLTNLVAESAHADDNPGAEVYRSLCASGAEGHYVVTTSWTRTLNVNIICTGFSAPTNWSSTISTPKRDSLVLYGRYGEKFL